MIFIHGDRACYLLSGYQLLGMEELSVGSGFYLNLIDVILVECSWTLKDTRSPQIVKVRGRVI